MDRIQDRRVALLEFTAKHYNRNNRAFSTDMARPVVNPTATSDGDPIGILLNDDELSGLAGAANQPGFIDRLPKWLAELGADFLFELQRLHDKPDYWTDTGISEEGRKRVDAIKRIMALYE